MNESTEYGYLEGPRGASRGCACLCFRVRQWAKAGFRVMMKDFETKKSFACSSLFRYYIKQKDSMLPCVCSVKDDAKMW